MTTRAERFLESVPKPKNEEVESGWYVVSTDADGKENLSKPLSSQTDAKAELDRLGDDLRNSSKVAYWDKSIKSWKTPARVASA